MGNDVTGPNLIAKAIRLLLCAGMAVSSSMALADPPDLHLPSQPLASALHEFSRQSGIQVAIKSDLIDSKIAPSVNGPLEPARALALLLDGSGLEAYSVNARTYGIRKVSVSTPSASTASSRPADNQAEAERPLVLAQAERANINDVPPSPERRTKLDSNDSGKLEEIVVTAQRRTERLQDVPISVTAYSQATMDAQGSRTIDDLSRLTPGVTFTRGGSNNNNSESSAIAIRGIFSDAGAATTGIYIDDTPIQSRHLSFPSFNAYPALFDIDRVEVLRGPQGTLFGSGSEGGTLRFISPEPGLDQFSAYARSEVAATAHGDPVYEAGAAGGGPLIDGRLGFRASVSYRHEGGYVDRDDWLTQQIADRDSNSNKTVTARLAVTWLASDNLSITPSMFYQKRNAADTSAWWAPRAGDPDPTNGQFAAPFRNGNAIAQPSSDEFALPALKITWQFAQLQLVSNTSYFKRQQSAITDYTQFDRAIFLGSPYSQEAGGQGDGYWGDNQRNWTQELRLESMDAGARVSWTAGVFYQHAQETTSHRVYDPLVQAALGLPADFAGGYIYVEDPRVGIDRQLAVFGQADIKVAEKLKLTLGLRYASTEFEGRANYPETLVVGPAVSSDATQKEHPVTPKVGLNYQLSAGNLLYATAAKGFRIGGVNAALGQFCGQQAPPTFASDSLWSYEVGSKNSFADNRVLLNASAYYVDWKNIQQNVGLACGFQYAANLGAAKSTGVDLQAQGKIGDAWLLGAAFGYTDARYTQSVSQPNVGAIVQSGDHLSGSPWTLSLFSQLYVPLYGHVGYLRADYQYSAKQTDLVPAQNPLNDGAFTLGAPGVPAQSYTSLRAGLKAGTLDVSLFAQNLFDTRPKLTSYNDLGGPTGGTPLFYDITWRPRTVGITAIYRH
jgi:iron complex outermembrane receptor protein